MVVRNCQSPRILSTASVAALADITKAANLMCMADKFPESLPGFQKMFPDDAACAKYLEAIRWRDNFKCPKCRAQDPPFPRVSPPTHVSSISTWVLTPMRPLVVAMPLRSLCKIWKAVS